MAPVLAGSSTDAPPLLWRAWADAVVLYWESCRAGGGLDPDAEAIVLDLGGTGGLLAWAMPAMLEERLRGSPCAGLRVRYLHDWPDGAVVNPLVCIAWRVLAALPDDDVYAVQRGHCHVAAGATWAPCAPPPGRAGALLAHYAARCGSAALTLPLAAMALLDEVALRSGGRYVFVGADAGVVTEAGLRAHGCGASGLNLHALLLDRAWAGDVTWCSEPSDGNCAVYLVASQPGHPMAFNALAAVLEQGHPDQGWALRDAAASLAPAPALQRAPALLRCAAYDPALLAACMPALLADGGIDEGAAAQWRAVLPATWCNYRLPTVSDGFYRDVCVLAAAAGDWGLAQAVLRSASDRYGADPHDLQLLAWCAAASGAMHDACDLLERAVALAPEDDAAHAALAAARERVRDAAAMHGYDASLARDGDLALEPLHADHAPALLYQYRDPGIAAMADLAGLHTVAQVRQWIRAQRLNGGLQAYAVMHARWGFVGAVFLRCGGPAAYFYFWTGCDFQGRGYGPQAAQLLWGLARHAGIANVYTSVYAGNLRSRGALARLGFAPLAVRAQAPDDELLFVHKPLHADGGAASLAELQRLCREIDSPLRLTPAHASPHSLTED